MRGDDLRSHERPRILFISEAVSLAHVSRPWVLANSLPAEQYEVHFACDPRFNSLFQMNGMQSWEIHSQPCETFLAALDSGGRLFSESVLRGYVSEELALFERVKPDIVVGDFRISLGVSAPARKIPYLAICNAHWSRYAELTDLPIPEYAITKIPGVKSLLRRLGPLVQPHFYRYHLRPLNRLRADFGLPPFAHFLDAFTFGDLTMYADTPRLVPTSGIPSNHRYIGPISWSPDIALPEWWNDLDPARPIVYMTLGSTGNTSRMSAVLEGVAKLPITVLLATAGRVEGQRYPPNVKAAPYLPGTLATKRSDLVVCNGGSATVYGALREGVPVLGIASNMDQLLTMSYVEAVGAGKLIRQSEVTPETVRSAVRALLDDRRVRSGAQQIAADFARYDTAANFEGCLREILARLRGGALRPELALVAN